MIAEYVAVQREPNDVESETLWFERVRKAFADQLGPDCFEEMRHHTKFGKTESVVIGYWTDPSRHAKWLITNDFNRWFAGAERGAEKVGYWRERLVVPYDRFETIFSEPYYTAGWARSRDCQLEPHYTAGYFGSMRDRLPLSAIDQLESAYPDGMLPPPCGETLGKRIQVALPWNAVSIRSGQYWQRATGEQLDDYYQSLQPKLDTGMAYLEEHPEVTGCLSMRHLVALDATGAELKETSKQGYFISLKPLEEWAASHQTHHAIFGHALAMRRKFGADRTVVTWHEVSVLASNPAFEYVNCHRDTGLLRFWAQWGWVESEGSADRG